MHLGLCCLWLGGLHKHVGGHIRLGGGNPQLVNVVRKEANIAPALGPIIAQLAAVPVWHRASINNVFLQGAPPYTARTAWQSPKAARQVEILTLPEASLPLIIGKQGG